MNPCVHVRLSIHAVAHGSPKATDHVNNGEVVCTFFHDGEVNLGLKMGLPENRTTEGSDEVGGVAVCCMPNGNPENLHVHSVQKREHHDGSLHNSMGDTMTHLDHGTFKMVLNIDNDWFMPVGGLKVQQAH